MDKTQVIENGDINDILNLNAFKIHDIMFNINDIVQCLFLCSKTAYDYYHSDLCNIFIITISTEHSFIHCMPMNINTEYVEAVMRNDDSITPQSEVFRKKNTFTMRDDKIMLCMTKGFIMDHYKVKESFHDFRIDPDSPKIVIYAKDFESLTVPDPDLE